MSHRPLASPELSIIHAIHVTGRIFIGSVLKNAEKSPGLTAKVGPCSERDLLPEQGGLPAIKDFIPKPRNFVTPQTWCRKHAQIILSHWRLPSFEQRFPHRVMPTGTLIPSATKITMSPFLPQSRCVTRWTPSEQVEKDRMPPAGPRCWGSGGTGTGSTRQLSVWRRSSPTGKARTLRTQTSRARCMAQGGPLCLGLLGYSVEALGASGARAQLAPSARRPPLESARMRMKTSAMKAP